MQCASPSWAAQRKDHTFITVRNHTIFTFRYGLANAEQQPDFGTPPAFPFQVQVDYVTPAGLQVARLMTENDSVKAAGKMIAYNSDVVHDAFIQQIAAAACDENKQSAQLLMRAECRLSLVFFWFGFPKTIALSF